MTAPDGLYRLVERFDENRDAYRSGAYNETQARREFIDPLFGLLGWDIDNTSGTPEAYKDVVHEDAIKVGGAHKAPDYGFRVGGARKFFVEAKKPSVNVSDDIGPAFQLRRYAWSAKLPVSILTDFEEFAVYDCRVTPDKKDSASTARLNLYSFEAYPEKWDEISGVFSKEAVLDGSLDTFAEKAKSKRGTATVDAVFLREIESWRETLARDLAMRNPDLTRRELNYAVQVTIDRIIFLRMAEDRGLENYGRLQALMNGKHAYGRLRDLYRQADERYNSGLFHFKPERGRDDDADTLTPRLEIGDDALKSIIKGLYYPDSPYEFSVLPIEVLGQVYEQFLGKVIDLSPNRAVQIEEKPEVRKAGGVYYTPKYIVDYIVEQTVGKLVEGKKPGPRGGVSKLRILDPACGSGSFLIGAYEYLLDWHRDQYLADGSEKHRNVLYQGQGGEWHLTTAEKKRILLNNIYGVDIDPQAVEVTKLSLLLKVLEGESSESLVTQLSMFHERALPDLSNNVKCGNSLIGPDFYESGQLSLLDPEDHFRINVFDWHSAFPGVFNGKDAGFDAVIGNPPYGANLHSEAKKYLMSKYPHQSYQLDSYLLFLEAIIERLLRQSGRYGMIIPNSWLTNLLQGSMRRYVVERARVVEIIHFLYSVFPKVTIDTEIVILEKGNPDGAQPDTVVVNAPTQLNPDTANAVATRLTHDQDRWRALDGGVINIFLGSTELAIADKCKVAGQPLDRYFDINVGIKPYQSGKGKPPQTREMVKLRPFDSDAPLDHSYRRYLRGKDIQRYLIAPLQSRYLKYGPWLAEPRPAANFDAPIKLLVRQTGDSIVAALDAEQFLCLNNLHVLVPKESVVDPYYVLGLLNSRLINWYYHSLNPEVGEALAEVKKANVARLPIRCVEKDVGCEATMTSKIAGLVTQILALKLDRQTVATPHERGIIEHRIGAIDRQIDRHVYELYGLTDEEIAVVEEAVS